MAEIRLTEPVAAPTDGLLLGAAAVLPMLAGAAAAWLLEMPGAGIAGGLTVLWSGAILVFLGGVRRGLSFRTPGGPTAAQLGVTFWLFLAGLLAIASPWAEAALVLLLAGFGSLALLDPWAARRGEAPPFFGRLRPWQSLVAVLALLALLVRVLRG